MANRPAGRAKVARVLGFLALCACASGASAQAPPAQSQARLQGVVVDEATGQPVAAATVSVGGTGMSVITGRWGTFEFPGAPPGPAALEVSAPDHPTVVQDIEVREGRVVFVRIVLPSIAAILDEIIVQSTHQRGASQAARTAADLLALQVPRTRVQSGVVGPRDYQLGLRGATSFQSTAPPMILVDGVVLSQGPGAFEALERIPAEDVERIEVLSGPAAAFLYPFAANGVIHVRTKRGTGVR